MGFASGYHRWHSFSSDAQVKLRRCQFDFDSFYGIVDAMGDDAEYIIDEVLHNEAMLFRVEDIGYCILRREGSEMVVVCYQGIRLKLFARFIVNLSKQNGCTSLRFHTKRPAMARALAELHPEPIEYVYRVNCHGKQEQESNV